MSVTAALLVAAEPAQADPYPMVVASGTVRSAAGDGIAGAQIGASFLIPALNFGWTGSTLTAADGTYSLEIPADATNGLLQTRIDSGNGWDESGFVYISARGLTTTTDDITQDFTAPTITHIDAQVLDTNTTPVAGAQVKWNQTDVSTDPAPVDYNWRPSTLPTCTTDATGHCTLPALTGTVSVAATVDVHVGSSIATIGDQHLVTVTTDPTPTTFTVVNYASVPSHGTVSGQVEVQSPVGTTLSEVTNAPVSPTGLPTGSAVLTGALSYTLTGIASGSTVDITLSLPAGSNPTSVFKLQSGSFVDVTSIATITGDTVVLHVTDGGLGDEDGVADGTIVDPVVPVGAAPPPPAGSPDSYVVGTGSTLTISAPGVLVNDASSGGALTATPASGAAHGTVSLASSGGFSYTPAPGYRGPDSFSYRAVDSYGSTSDLVTVAITVTGNGPVIVVPGGASISEGDAGTSTVQVPVALNRPAAVPVSVAWNTVNTVGADRAQSPADYVAASGTVTFAPGQTTATVTVTVNGDTDLEADELIVISFHDATNATVGGFYGLGFGGIINDDGALAVIPGGASVRERDHATNVVDVPVRLTRPAASTVTVDWNTLNTTGPDRAQSPEDYVAANGTVTFAPGETAKTVPIAVNGDNLVEADELIVVSFHNATNAAVGGFYGLGFGGIINDDDTIVAPGGASRHEGATGTSTVDVPVYLSKPSTSPVTVQWNTVNTTGPDRAQAPADYVAANGTVTFAPGQTTATVTVTINGDTDLEADELIVISFHDATNASVGGFYGLGFGGIINDDGARLVLPGGASIHEDATGTTTVEVPVYLSQASAQTVTVAWNTLDTAGADRASSSNDYLAASGTVTFAPGETRKTISITVNGDVVPEPDELIVISFHNATNATVGGFYGLGFGGIINDD